MKIMLSIIMLFLTACGGSDSTSPGPSVISHESVTVIDLQFAYDPATNIPEPNPFHATVTNDGNVDFYNLYFEFTYISCAATIADCTGTILNINRHSGFMSSLAVGETKDVHLSYNIQYSGLRTARHEVSFSISKETPACFTCSYTPLATKEISFVTHT